MIPSPLLLERFEPQRYLFDCAASSVANIARLFGLAYGDYDALMRQLHVTSRWGTNPKYIEQFFHSHALEFSPTFSDINIILVSQDCFYGDDHPDYGHYVIALATTQNSFLVYDVHGGESISRSEAELRACMQTVLIGRTKRYTDVCFGFSLDSSSQRAG